MKPALRIKRIYEPPAREDGARILVDRLWPRGVRKKSAALTAWLKEIGPRSIKTSCRSSYAARQRTGQLDESVRALGIIVLKSTPHSPKMNAVCERAIGTARRECLDWLIPLSESHLHHEYFLAPVYA
jgi:transposase InsO family protein